MEFRILGPLAVACNGKLLALGTPKTRRLLACLVLNANEVVSIDRIAAAIWGENPPGSATHAIQNHVSELRREFRLAGMPPPIVTKPPGYLLEADDSWIDAARFESLLDAAHASIRQSATTEALEEVEAALALWRGEVLVDFAYEEFAQEEIRRLTERRDEARELRFEALVSTGRHDDVVADLERHVAAHPLRERPRALLMTALDAGGRSAEALDIYQDFRLGLANELGLEPSDRLRRLETDIIRHTNTAEAAPRTVPDGPGDGTRPARRSAIVWAAAIGAIVMGAVLAGALLVGGDDLTIGLLFGGRGDDAWGDLVGSGVDMAIEGTDATTSELLVSLSDSAMDLEQKVRSLARTSDVVVVGWSFAADAVASVAGEFPDTWFVLIDGVAEGPNVSSYVFREDQGAYLAGAAAALQTRSGRLGFIGGSELPIVDRYLTGFEEGATAVRPESTVDVEYLAPATDPIRGFVDTAAAADAARLMYARGVDVIFHAAGRAGIGIAGAARLESSVQDVTLWMIGVDVDEAAIAPAGLQPYVLTSVVKRADVATLDALTAFRAGTLTAEIVQLGIAEGGIELVSTRALEPHRPTLDAMVAQLSSGR